MTPKQMVGRAWNEWHGSDEMRSRYHTFSHYWRECYERVYQLDSSALRHIHRAIEGYLAA